MPCQGRGSWCHAGMVPCERLQGRFQGSTTDRRRLLHLGRQRRRAIQFLLHNVVDVLLRNSSIYSFVWCEMLRITIDGLTGKSILLEVGPQGSFVQLGSHTCG
jgi:hypothetical protein